MTDETSNTYSVKLDSAFSSDVFECTLSFPRYKVGLLGAEIEGADFGLAVNARLDMIEKHVLRIEKVLSNNNLCVDDLPLD